MEFRSSDPLGIGMELELQLLDARTLDLVDGILPLLELYPNSPYVKPEFIQNTVEIASRVCTSLPELESHVASLVVELKARCQALGMRLCGAGTHPFGQRLALITPLPRYRRMEKEERYISHTQVTFATHVHIGMISGDMAIRVMKDLKAYLPLLIALSASSPFWRGYDTGHVSYRHRILAASRSYGIPPAFKCWEDFVRFLETTRHAGIFEVIRDIHWDIRPQPQLGSLEVRVMDAQPTVAEAVALAGLVRALVFYLEATRGEDRPGRLPASLPWWLAKHNHYQAGHLGLAAQYIQDEQGTVRPMLTVFHEVMEAVAETAEKLGQSEYLERLRRTVERGVSYQRQRTVYRQTGSLQRVAAALVDELEGD